MNRAQCAVTLIACVLASPAMAGGVEWADWTIGTNNYPSSVVVGQFGGAFSGVGISYNGGAEFYQANGGTNYWIPTSTYTSAGVTNAPSSSDAIGLSSWNVTHTLTFTPAVTNPLMAISSLGAPWFGSTTTWTFDAPFTILSQGAGYFGGGSTSLVSGPNNTLLGSEGNGVIEFQGTYSSISWTVINGENFAAFTVGLIPAPGSAVMLALGVLASARRRR
jgi:hypothetical protein